MFLARGVQSGAYGTPSPGMASSPLSQPQLSVSQGIFRVLALEA